MMCYRCSSFLGSTLQAGTDLSMAYTPVILVKDHKSE